MTKLCLTFSLFSSSQITLTLLSKKCISASCPPDLPGLTIFYILPDSTSDFHN